VDFKIFIPASPAIMAHRFSRCPHELVIRKPLTSDLLAMKSGSREKKSQSGSLSVCRGLEKSFRSILEVPCRVQCQATLHLLASGFSEVRGLPVAIECRPCVPGLVESDFRKRTGVTEDAIWVHCVAFTRSSTSRIIRLHRMTWKTLLFAIA